MYVEHGIITLIFVFLSTCAISKMAAGISSFLNKIAALGLGVAVVGGVVNTALYNGKYYSTVGLFKL